MPADRTRLPSLGPERPFTFPEIRSTTLANGLRVWTVQHSQVPLVALLAIVPVGASSEPPDRPEASPRSRATCWTKARAIGRARGPRSARRIGAQLDLEIGHDATVLALTTLERPCRAASS